MAVGWPRSAAHIGCVLSLFICFVGGALTVVLFTPKSPVVFTSFVVQGTRFIWTKKKKKKTLLLSPSSTKWLASPSSIRGCVLATQGVFLVCFMRRPIDIYCPVRAFVNSFSVPGYKWLSAFVNASCQQLSNFTSILAPKQFSAGGFSLSKPAVSGSTCLTVEVCPSFYFSFY